MVLLAPLGFGRDIREQLVHGPSIVALSPRDDLAPTRRRNPHAGSAYNRGNQAISGSLERSVVLTIGRLVASNPSFASARVPADRCQSKPQQQHDAWTIPLLIS
jgi:hypothetical protein